MSLFSPIAPFDIVLFGGDGDLALRKLLPALFCQFLERNVTANCRIIGVSRSKLTTQTYREEVEAALLRFYPPSATKRNAVIEFLNILSYVQINLVDRENAGWDTLRLLFPADTSEKNRIFYFSTAPALFPYISENLAHHNLITPHSRAVLEKPIGRDGKSANAINEAVGSFFSEEQIFRIDHYLGKESTQNILQFRFSNPLIEAVWSGKYIKNIEITASETVGLESRASYYDTSGAARDMIQNHLLQVLSLCAIDRPASLSGDDIRKEKIAVLQALKPLTPEEIETSTIRGQYTDGTAEGRAVPSYAKELGKESQTETFAAIQVKLDLPRWEGTNFCLKTGKRMKEKRTDIKITFRRDATLFHHAPSNKMMLDLQDTNDISVELNVRSIGFSNNSDGLRSLRLEGSYSPPQGVRSPASYETLLMAVAQGDQSLFIHREEIDAAWKWIEPILKSWENNVPELLYYPSGGAIPKFSEINKTDTE